MPKATIDDVAELASVSIKTVSRVVNREPNVSEPTREKVERAIAQLHYRPNPSAQNLASHRSHLIVLIYDDPSAYEIPSAGYVIRMQQGTLRACREANFELLIHPCRYDNKDVVTELRTLIEQVRPAGIVLAAPLSNMPRIVRAIEATATSLVPLSPGKKDNKRFSVATNDREISAEMTRYLASLGHERIAFIKGNEKHKAVGNRYLGYLDGLSESGITLSEQYVVTGDNSIGSGEECAAKLLQLKKPPTAIFAANDDMSAGVMRVASKLGINVPGELSIAGCDDISLARQLYPSLTTIRQPLSKMAEQATLALIDEARHHSSKHGTTIIPATIKIRESTGPAPD